jgi:tetratricopeptide (TPR) repeat protein
MREHHEDERKYSWILYSFFILIVGGLAGYVLAAGDTRASGVPVQTSAAQAAVNAGNLLYDAHRYVEAIPFYQQAFALNRSDVNVSTDLGTALWYAGRPDDALAQYDQSLKISPTHAQTLFNAGIVHADGKHDYAGAIDVWEKLLATNPGYPNAAGVRELLTDARGKTRSAKP